MKSAVLVTHRIFGAEPDSSCLTTFAGHRWRHGYALEEGPYAPAPNSKAATVATAGKGYSRYSRLTQPTTSAPKWSTTSTKWVCVAAPHGLPSQHELGIGFGTDRTCRRVQIQICIHGCTPVAKPPPSCRKPVWGDNGSGMHPPVDLEQANLCLLVAMLICPTWPFTTSAALSNMQGAERFHQPRPPTLQASGSGF